MADGQLTGAAQYAQGLGVQLLPTSGTLAGYTNTIVTVNPTTRTLIVNVAFIAGTVSVPTLTIVGQTTGIQYYGAPMYVVSGFGSPLFSAVVPILSTLDSAVSVTITPGAFTYTLTVNGDTAQYSESVLYNGQGRSTMAARAVSGTTVLLNGPARLLTVEVRSTTALVNAFIFWDGVEILHANANATSQISSTLAFPPNTLLSSGSTIALSTAGVGAATGTVVSAYP